MASRTKAVIETQNKFVYICVHLRFAFFAFFAIFCGYSRLEGDG